MPHSANITHFQTNTNEHHHNNQSCWLFTTSSSSSSIIGSSKETTTTIRFGVGCLLFSETVDVAGVCCFRVATLLLCAANAKALVYLLVYCTGFYVRVRCLWDAGCAGCLFGDYFLAAKHFGCMYVYTNQRDWLKPGVLRITYY